MIAETAPEANFTMVLRFTTTGSIIIVVDVCVGMSYWNLSISIASIDPSNAQHRLLLFPGCLFSRYVIMLQFSRSSTVILRQESSTWLIDCKKSTIRFKISKQGGRSEQAHHFFQQYFRLFSKDERWRTTCRRYATAILVSRRRFSKKLPK